MLWTQRKRVKLAGARCKCHLAIMTLSPIGALVRRHDPDRFLTALFAPVEKREPMFALFAFNHELARAREVASLPILALIRLQWWREVVEGMRRRHEVAGPLGEALDSGALLAADLQAMIAGREAEADERMADHAAWTGYVLGAFGGVAVAAGRLLGAGDSDLVRLQLLGAAYGCAGQINSVAMLAGQERCQLPDDLLTGHGLTRDHVLRDPASAAPVLASLANAGRAWLEAGGGRYPGSVIAAALPGVLARRDLRRGSRRRGIVDRLAVTVAALTGRI